MANILTFTPHPSAAETATGQTADQTLPQGTRRVRFDFAVTAVSGTTPSMTPKIQGKNASGNYVDLATGTAMTAVGSQSILVEDVPLTYRIAWTISGTTPSFTFDADAVAETQ